MTALLLLIPISMGLALVSLVAFVWTFGAGQYEDPRGDAERILYDHLDEGPPA